MKIGGVVDGTPANQRKLQREKMGRRKKAAKKVAKKKKAGVARTFKCLFCNHEDVVSCRLDMKSMTGKLKGMIVSGYSKIIAQFYLFHF